MVTKKHGSNEIADIKVMLKINVNDKKKLLWYLILFYIIIWAELFLLSDIKIPFIDGSFRSNRDMIGRSITLKSHEWGAKMLSWYRVHIVVLNDPGCLFAVHLMVASNFFTTSVIIPTYCLIISV